ncbi:MAG: hypothetical protein L0207_05715 [Chlamydiae bacterium]|nr:hypothetical protein [Chlamydiota bacterium]
MKNFPNIKDIVASKNWKFLVRNSLPVNISDYYSFSEAMHIVDHLIQASTEEIIKDGSTADLMRDYCVNLMTILRTKYREEWKKDWKNEAFLGIICALVYREEEAFKYIKNAYKQSSDPPQSLILAYISAGSGPDHFLTKKEIIELSQKAIEKGISYEAALRMSALAYEQKDQNKHEYWQKQAIEAEKNGFHTPIIVPNVLKDLFNEENGYQYEE